MFGSKTLKSKNACCARSQKPRVLISNVALFELLYVLSCSSFPDNGVSLGSISVSLHIIFGVRSHKLLCRMDLKPPFLRLILCWISNLLRQGRLGILLISQPYCSLTESQNCCLDHSYPYSVIESTANLFTSSLSWYIHKTFFFVIYFCC